jgi:hypothetical protein
MAQPLAAGLHGVLLSVAAIAWRTRSLRAGQGIGRYPSLRPVGEMLRSVGGRSLPVEGFEDWKLHYLRIAISALPSRHPPDFGWQRGVGRCERRQAARA